MTDHATLLEAAIAWHAAGAAVLPVRPDGTKAPAVTWKNYQQVRPDPDQVLAWFGASQFDGLGILTGHVSGDLEMLEFEGRAVNTGLLTELQQLADDNDMGHLIDRLAQGYAETTPSGGVHLIYRVTDGVVQPNTKLARTIDRQVLAETRGEGGFVVVAPSFGRSHPTALPWAMFQGAIDTIPTLTGDERDRLWALVRMLDQEPARDPLPDFGPSLPGGSTNGTRPGDDYNQRTTWEEILEPRGWRQVFRMGRGYAWRRPGKDIGISATTGQAADGVDRLYVFTTSTEFESERPYSKFAATALLEHGGDYSATAKALSAGGYGTPPQQPLDRPATAVDEPAFGYVEPRREPPSPVAAVTTTTTPVEPEPELLADPERLDLAPASTLARSEDGFSQAVIAEYGSEIRYCHQMGRWLHWDGARWHVEAPGGGIVREFAKNIARAYPNDNGWATHKKRSLTNAGVSGALSLSTTDFRVEVSIDELDARPWELNTPAGIINLRTGAIAPADPTHLHTKTTSVAPDYGADQSPWLEFLDTTFQGDTEMIGYIQRLMGYACIGEVREHILPVFYGQGANGKTVLLETVQAVLGDYATVAPQRFLIQGPAQHATEVAALAGARLVIASETNEGERFDEAKVKLLTGGDRIKARFMRQDEFTFPPSWLLVLLTNHLPEVGSGGTSFWRRVRQILFGHIVPEHQRDAGLTARLVDQHGPAIMAWLAQGAALYATNGLQEPASVRVATQAYEASTDTVARFVDDMCILGGGDIVKINSARVRETYETWCRAEGEIPISAKTLTTQLMGRYEIGRHKGAKGARFLTGITIVGDSEPATLDEPPGDDPWRNP